VPRQRCRGIVRKGVGLVDEERGNTNPTPTLFHPTPITFTNRYNNVEETPSPSPPPLYTPNIPGHTIKIPQAKVVRSSTLAPIRISKALQLIMRIWRIFLSGNSSTWPKHRYARTHVEPKCCLPSTGWHHDLHGLSLWQSVSRGIGNRAIRLRLW